MFYFQKEKTALTLFTSLSEAKKKGELHSPAVKANLNSLSSASLTSEQWLYSLYVLFQASAKSSTAKRNVLN